MGQEAASKAHHCANTNVGSNRAGQICVSKKADGNLLTKISYVDQKEAINKMRTILTIIAFTTWTTLLACDCKTSSLKKLQDLSYDESPLIFVGDVLTSNQKTGTYKIKVVEIFKGQTKTTIIEGKSLTSCSGFPDRGRWIIYTETYKDGVIDFNSCGLSRSFENPQFIMVTEYKVPPPPSKEYETESKYSIQANIDFERAMLKLKEKALTDLEIEIEDLRKRK